MPLPHWGEDSDPVRLRAQQCRQEKREGYQPADGADLGGGSPERGERCFWGWSFGNTVTGVSPVSARWMCRPSSLAPPKEETSVLGLLCGVFVLWRLRPWLPEQGLWKIPPVSKGQAGTCRSRGIIANRKKAARCRQSCFGLDRLPRASPLRATWPSFLAPEHRGGLWDGKPFWFQWMQESASLQSGLPGEGRNLFLKEGLFNTLLLWSPWKWQPDPNKKSASLGKGGPNFPPLKSRLWTTLSPPDATVLGSHLGEGSN